MNKHLLTSVLMLLVLVMSCTDDSINHSGLDLSHPDTFIITDMQAGLNGETHCIGYLFGTTLTHIKTYDKNLELIREINLNKPGLFQGKPTLRMDNKGGWVVADAVNDNNECVLTLYRTDDQFNILTSRKLFSTALLHDNKSAQICDLLIEPDNDILINLDTSQIGIDLRGFLHDDFGIKIIKLSDDLTTVFDHTLGTEGIDPGYTDKFNARILLLADGNIFYIYDATRNQDQGNEHIMGLLSPDGKLIYQKVRPKEFDWGNNNSLTVLGDQVVHNYSANNEYWTVFDLIDPYSGDTKDRFKVSFNYDFESYEMVIEERVNRPSPYGSNQIGFAIFRGDEQCVKFCTLDQDLDFTEHFKMPLPTGSAAYSYRQLISDRGTIIIGASIYDGKKENRSFVLQELTKDGKLIQ
ncbi:MAG: hypothetical protein H6608_03420 [Flavobacteriales bacterium]|nr:hypothetical protein [Flavobacteriales bacterium]